MTEEDRRDKEKRKSALSRFVHEARDDFLVWLQNKRSRAPRLATEDSKKTRALANWDQEVWPMPREPESMGNLQDKTPSDAAKEGHDEHGGLPPLETSAEKPPSNSDETTKELERMENLHAKSQSDAAAKDDHCENGDLPPLETPEKLPSNSDGISGEQERIANSRARTPSDASEDSYHESGGLPPLGISEKLRLRSSDGMPGKSQGMASIRSKTPNDTSNDTQEENSGLSGESLETTPWNSDGKSGRTCEKDVLTPLDSDCFPSAKQTTLASNDGSIRNDSAPIASSSEKQAQPESPRGKLEKGEMPVPGDLDGLLNAEQTSSPPKRDAVNKSREPEESSDKPSTPGASSAADTKREKDISSTSESPEDLTSKQTKSAFREEVVSGTNAPEEVLRNPLPPAALDGSPSAQRQTLENSGAQQTTAAAFAKGDIGLESGDRQSDGEIGGGFVVYGDCAQDTTDVKGTSRGAAEEREIDRETAHHKDSSSITANEKRNGQETVDRALGQGTTDATRVDDKKIAMPAEQREVCTDRVSPNLSSHGSVVENLSVTRDTNGVSGTECDTSESLPIQKHDAEKGIPIRTDLERVTTDAGERRVLGEHSEGPATQTMDGEKGDVSEQPTERESKFDLQEMYHLSKEEHQALLLVQRQLKFEDSCRAIGSLKSKGAHLPKLIMPTAVSTTEEDKDDVNAAENKDVGNTQEEVPESQLKENAGCNTAPNGEILSVQQDKVLEESVALQPSRVDGESEFGLQRREEDIGPLKPPLGSSRSPSPTAETASDKVEQKPRTSGSKSKTPVPEASRTSRSKVTGSRTPGSRTPGLLYLTPEEREEAMRRQKRELERKVGYLESKANFTINLVKDVMTDSLPAKAEATEQPEGDEGESTTSEMLEHDYSSSSLIVSLRELLRTMGKRFPDRKSRRRAQAAMKYLESIQEAPDLTDQDVAGHTEWLLRDGVLDSLTFTLLHADHPVSVLTATGLFHWTLHARLALGILEPWPGVSDTLQAVTTAVNDLSGSCPPTVMSTLRRLLSSALDLMLDIGPRDITGNDSHLHLVSLMPTLWFTLFDLCPVCDLTTWTTLCRVINTLTRRNINWNPGRCLTEELAVKWALFHSRWGCGRDVKLLPIATLLSTLARKDSLLTLMLDKHVTVPAVMGFIPRSRASGSQITSCGVRILAGLCQKDPDYLARKMVGPSCFSSDGRPGFYSELVGDLGRRDPDYMVFRAYSDQALCTLVDELAFVLDEEDFKFSVKMDAVFILKHVLKETAFGRGVVFARYEMWRKVILRYRDSQIAIALLCILVEIWHLFKGEKLQDCLQLLAQVNQERPNEQMGFCLTANLLLARSVAVTDVPSATMGLVWRIIMTRQPEVTSAKHTQALSASFKLLNTLVTVLQYADEDDKKRHYEEVLRLGDQDGFERVLEVARESGHCSTLQHKAGAVVFGVMHDFRPDWLSSVLATSVVPLIVDFLHSRDTSLHLVALLTLYQMLSPDLYSESVMRALKKAKVPKLVKSIRAEQSYSVFYDLVWSVSSAFNSDFPKDGFFRIGNSIISVLRQRLREAPMVIKLGRVLQPTAERSHTTFTLQEAEVREREARKELACQVSRLQRTEEFEQRVSSSKTAKSGKRKAGSVEETEKLLWSTLGDRSSYLHFGFKVVCKRCLVREAVKQRLAFERGDRSFSCIFRTMLVDFRLSVLINFREIGNIQRFVEQQLIQHCEENPHEPDTEEDPISLNGYAGDDDSDGDDDDGGADRDGGDGEDVEGDSGGDNGDGVVGDSGGGDDDHDDDDDGGGRDGADRDGGDGECVEGDGVVGDGGSDNGDGGDDDKGLDGGGEGRDSGIRPGDRHSHQDNNNQREAPPSPQLHSELKFESPQRGTQPKEDGVTDRLSGRELEPSQHEWPNKENCVTGETPYPLSEHHEEHLQNQKAGDEKVGVDGADSTSNIEIVLSNDAQGEEGHVKITKENVRCTSEEGLSLSHAETGDTDGSMEDSSHCSDEEGITVISNHPKGQDANSKQSQIQDRESHTELALSMLAQERVPGITKCQSQHRSTPTKRAAPLLMVRPGEDYVADLLEDPSQSVFLSSSETVIESFRRDEAVCENDQASQDGSETSVETDEEFYEEKPEKRILTTDEEFYEEKPEKRIQTTNEEFYEEKPENRIQTTDEEFYEEKPENRIQTTDEEFYEEKPENRMQTTDEDFYEAKPENRLQTTDEEFYEAKPGNRIQTTDEKFYEEKPENRIQTTDEEFYEEKPENRTQNTEEEFYKDNPAEGAGNTSVRPHRPEGADAKESSALVRSGSENNDSPSNLGDAALQRNPQKDSTRRLSADPENIDETGTEDTKSLIVKKSTELFLVLNHTSPQKRTGDVMTTIGLAMVTDLTEKLPGENVVSLPTEELLTPVGDMAIKSPSQISDRFQILDGNKTFRKTRKSTVTFTGAKTTSLQNLCDIATDELPQRNDSMRKFSEAKTVSFHSLNDIGTDEFPSITETRGKFSGARTVNFQSLDDIGTEDLPPMTGSVETFSEALTSSLQNLDYIGTKELLRIKDRAKRFPGLHDSTLAYDGGSCDSSFSNDLSSRQMASLGSGDCLGRESDIDVSPVEVSCHSSDDEVFLSDDAMQAQASAFAAYVHEVATQNGHETETYEEDESKLWDNKYLCEEDETNSALVAIKRHQDAEEPGIEDGNETFTVHLKHEKTQDIHEEYLTDFELRVDWNHFSIPDDKNERSAVCKDNRGITEVATDENNEDLRESRPKYESAASRRHTYVISTSATGDLANSHVDESERCQHESQEAEVTSLSPGGDNVDAQQQNGPHCRAADMQPVAMAAVTNISENQNSGAAIDQHPPSETDFQLAEEESLTTEEKDLTTKCVKEPTDAPGTSSDADSSTNHQQRQCVGIGERAEESAVCMKEADSASETGPIGTNEQNSTHVGVRKPVSENDPRDIEEEHSVDDNHIESEESVGKTVSRKHARDAREQNSAEDACVQNDGGLSKTVPENIRDTEDETSAIDAHIERDGDLSKRDSDNGTGEENTANDACVQSDSGLSKTVPENNARDTEYEQYVIDAPVEGDGGLRKTVSENNTRNMEENNSVDNSCVESDGVLDFELISQHLLTALLNGEDVLQSSDATDDSDDEEIRDPLTVVVEIHNDTLEDIKLALDDEELLEVLQADYEECAERSVLHSLQPQNTRHRLTQETATQGRLPQDGPTQNRPTPDRSVQDRPAQNRLTQHGPIQNMPPQGRFVQDQPVQDRLTQVVAMQDLPMPERLTVMRLSLERSLQDVPVLDRLTQGTPVRESSTHNKPVHDGPLRVECEQKGPTAKNSATDDERSHEGSNKDGLLHAKIADHYADIADSGYHQLYEVNYCLPPGRHYDNRASGDVAGNDVKATADGSGFEHEHRLSSTDTREQCVDCDWPNKGVRGGIGADNHGFQSLEGDMTLVETENRMAESTKRFGRASVTSGENDSQNASDAEEEDVFETAEEGEATPIKLQVKTNQVPENKSRTARSAESLGPNDAASAEKQNQGSHSSRYDKTGTELETEKGRDSESNLGDTKKRSSSLQNVTTIKVPGNRSEKNRSESVKQRVKLARVNAGGNWRADQHPKQFESTDGKSDPGRHHKTKTSSQTTKGDGKTKLPMPNSQTASHAIPCQKISQHPRKELVTQKTPKASHPTKSAGRKSQSHQNFRVGKADSKLDTQTAGSKENTLVHDSTPVSVFSTTGRATSTTLDQSMKRTALTLSLHSEPKTTIDKNESQHCLESESPDKEEMEESAFGTVNIDTKSRFLGEIQPNDTGICSTEVQLNSNAQAANPQHDKRQYSSTAPTDNEVLKERSGKQNKHSETSKTKETKSKQHQSEGQHEKGKLVSQSAAKRRQSGASHVDKKDQIPVLSASQDKTPAGGHGQKSKSKASGTKIDDVKRRSTPGGKLLGTKSDYVKRQSSSEESVFGTKSDGIRRQSSSEGKTFVSKSDDVKLTNTQGTQHQNLTSSHRRNIKKRSSVSTEQTRVSSENEPVSGETAESTTGQTGSSKDRSNASDARNKCAIITDKAENSVGSSTARRKGKRSRSSISSDHTKAAYILMSPLKKKRLMSQDSTATESDGQEHNHEPTKTDLTHVEVANSKPPVVQAQSHPTFKTPQRPKKRKPRAARARHSSDSSQGSKGEFTSGAKREFTSQEDLNTDRLTLVNSLNDSRLSLANFVTEKDLDSESLLSLKHYGVHEQTTGAGSKRGPDKISTEKKETDNTALYAIQVDKQAQIKPESRISDGKRDAQPDDSSNPISETTDGVECKPVVDQRSKCFQDVMNGSGSPRKESSKEKPTSHSSWEDIGLKGSSSSLEKQNAVPTKVGKHNIHETSSLEDISDPFYDDSIIDDRFSAFQQTDAHDKWGLVVQLESALPSDTSNLGEADSTKTKRQPRKSSGETAHKPTRAADGYKSETLYAVGSVADDVKANASFARRSSAETPQNVSRTKAKKIVLSIRKPNPEKDSQERAAEVDTEVATRKKNRVKIRRDLDAGEEIKYSSNPVVPERKPPKKRSSLLGLRKKTKKVDHDENDSECNTSDSGSANSSKGDDSRDGDSATHKKSKTSPLLKIKRAFRHEVKRRRDAGLNTSREKSAESKQKEEQAGNDATIEEQDELFEDSADVVFSGEDRTAQRSDSSEKTKADGSPVTWKQRIIDCVRSEERKRSEQDIPFIAPADEKAEDAVGVAEEQNSDSGCPDSSSLPSAENDVPSELGSEPSIKCDTDRSKDEPGEEDKESKDAEGESEARQTVPNTLRQSQPKSRGQQHKSDQKTAKNEPELKRKPGNVKRDSKRKSAHVHSEQPAREKAKDKEGDSKQTPADNDRRSSKRKSGKKRQVAGDSNSSDRKTKADKDILKGESVPSPSVNNEGNIHSDDPNFVDPNAPEKVKKGVNLPPEGGDATQANAVRDPEHEGEKEQLAGNARASTPEKNNNVELMSTNSSSRSKLSVFSRIFRAGQDKANKK